jgi:hypothetical protein
MTDQRTREITEYMARIIRFHCDLHGMSSVMQYICCRSDVVELIAKPLFWVICGDESTSAEAELQRLESQDMILSPEPVDSPTTIDSVSPEFDRYQSEASQSSKASVLKRGGLSTLVTKTSPHAVKRSQSMLTRARYISNMKKIDCKFLTFRLGARPFALAVVRQPQGSLTRRLIALHRID